MLETRSTQIHRERGDVSLARLVASRIDLGRWLTIAIRLADELAALHARGVAHLGLRPEIITVRGDRVSIEEPVPELSSHGASHGVAAARPHRPARAWPYLSPEQTGRLRVEVDHRSDLYSLGVILHELLTGAPPFSAEDLPGWIHAHVAVRPPPASDVVPAVPRVVADIVLRLLAKAPEDRYQSASGLRHDLERCLERWRTAHTVEPFVIGRMDPPPPPRVTATLHGREDELDRLLAALARAETEPAPQVVLVSGPTGVGKTALVEQLRAVALDRGALYASGKCAASSENRPLLAAQQALDGVLAAALESNAWSHVELRGELESALGLNAALLTALLPELEHTIGKLGQTLDLQAPEAEQRFLVTLGSYLGALARPRAPLVLFLDDLQWADAGTLRVLEHAATDPAVHHTLLIGAYRGTELEVPPAIADMLGRLARSGVEPTRISLHPLTPDAVSRWIADVLRRPVHDIDALAQVVHERTGGSPLFVAQFLEALYHEGLVRYSLPRSAWLWDLDRIRAKEYSDDVADLIAERIRTLSPETQDALRLFAAHGASAHLRMLAVVLGDDEAGVLARLREALRARLVARVGDELRFLHDRFHQTAYELTPLAQRPAMHRALGRALLAEVGPERLADHVFEIVRHLDLADGEIESEKEQARIAELDLIAARAARAANDTPAAIAFLTRGITRLAPDAWERRYDLAFQLHLSLARCRFATGDLEETRELCRALIRRTRSDVDRAKVHALLADALLIAGSMEDAVDACLDGLRPLGIDLPSRPSDASVDAAYQATLARLGSEPERALQAELPPMGSETARAACDLLAAIQPAAAYLDWKLVWRAGCAGVDLSMRHGTTSSSPAAYSAFALGLADRYHRYHDAFAFGAAAYRIALRPENAPHRARATFGFAALLSYLEMPIHDCVAMLRTELAHAAAIGDLAFACYHSKHAADFRFVAGDPLDEVAVEAERAASFARRAGYDVVADILRSRALLVDRLRGAPEAGAPDPLAAHPFALTRFHLAFHDLVRAFVLGELDEAARAATRARGLASAVVGFRIVPESHFYGALAETSRLPTPEPGARTTVPDVVRGDREVLAGLAASAPGSFGDRAALVAAEIARLEGDVVGAEHGYEDAIRRAREARSAHVEAFACELAAKFHASRGLETVAVAYRTAAHDAHELWGARARAAALQAAHPEIDAAVARLAHPLESAEAAGILKASQAITGTLLLPELHARLLAVAIEQAGAQRGCLVLANGQGLTLAAASGADADRFGIAAQRAVSTALPLSMCDAAIRTRRAVLLADATASHRYSADPYFVRRTTRSALALPIVREDQCTAVLYLENGLVAGAFSSTQLAVLDVLASQAAISFENARLYSGLQQEIVERRAAEARLAQSEALLHAIVHNANALVWVKDLEGRYTLANPRFAELVHLEPEQITGKTDRMLFADSVAERLRERDLQVIAEKRTIESDDSIPHDDGVHDYLTERCPLRDAQGRIQAVCGIATDVTARNRGASELRHSLSLLEAALESTADGILVVDRAGRIVRTNRRFITMWSVPPEIVESHDDSRALAHVVDQLEDPDAFLARVHQLYASPEDTSFDTLRFRDGRVLERYSQAQWIGDDIVGRVWSFRDVSERVRAEEQRDRLLEEEKRARTAAEEAVRMRDEFLSIASHELRTPLTSLQLAVDGLSLRMARGGTVDPAQVDRVLTVSKRQIRRLTALVGLLLDVSRFRGGRLELHRNDVDLRTVVQEVGSLLSDELARSGSTLEIRAPEPVVGRWDALRVEQVVTNLMTNAIKFGGGRPIEVIVERQGDAARLVVVDHGIGIAPGMQSRIFAAFQRGVSWKNYGGLGLGLFITRVIVEAHGGEIGLASTVGQGATFTVVLPITPPLEPEGPQG